MSKRKIDEEIVEDAKRYKEMITFEIFHKACKQGDLDIVRKGIEQKIDINEICKYGLTPLGVAVENNNITIVKELIKANVDLNKRSGRDRDTALSIACIKGRDDIAEELISAGCAIEIKHTYGYTPFYYACLNFNYLCALKLYHYGASVEGVSINGRNVLYWMSQYSSDSRPIRIYPKFLFFFPLTHLKKARFWLEHHYESNAYLYKEIEIREKIYWQSTTKIFIGNKESTSILSLLPRDMFREIVENFKRVM
jgi:ankyrin repeat protein